LEQRRGNGRAGFSECLGDAAQPYKAIKCRYLGGGVLQENSCLCTRNATKRGGDEMGKMTDDFWLKVAALLLLLLDLLADD
jgi:hypothetical protein